METTSMNKINISDYSFTPAEARAYFAFMQWINANPYGGYFKSGEVELNVWVKQSVFITTIKEKVCKQ